MRFAHQRAFNRDHLAWFRAVAEGISASEAWGRYLFLEGEFSDAWSDELLAWSLAEVRIVLAKASSENFEPLLGRIRLNKATSSVSLDELREEFPDDFYSEAELLGILRERELEEQAGSGLQGGDLLRLRLLSSIVETHLGAIEGAQLHDPVLRWFRGSVSDRLMAIGLNTLWDVLQASKQSKLWYRDVPGLGAIGAQRVVEWLDRNFGSALPSPSPVLGLSVVTDQPAPGGDVLAPGEVFGASDDELAVRGWIKVKARNSPETRKYYEKEARRFFIFLKSELDGTPLSSITPEICANFFDWMQAVGRDDAVWRWSKDAKYWLCKPSTRLVDPGWRPFNKPVSATNLAASRRALNAMFAYLREIGHLRVNPMSALPRQSDRGVNLRFRSHALSSEHIELLRNLSGSGRCFRRDKVLVSVALCTGLRASELRGLRARDFQLLHDGWWISVIGKGGKLREVPIEDTVAGLVEEWVGRPLGLEDYPRDEVFCQVDRLGARIEGSQLSYQSILRSVARYCSVASCKLEESGDTRGARRLSMATTHWLRHSFATSLLDGPSPAPINAVQQALGHSDLSSTSVYTKIDGEVLRRALRR